MKVTAAAKVGLTAVLVAFVLVAIYKGMGSRIPWLTAKRPDSYEIAVGFRSVRGLDPGADVQLNGNPVGEVGEIVNDPFGGVQVTLLIHRGETVIHEHAKFSIARESIFGGYTVSIEESRSGQMITPETAAEDQIVVRVDKGAVGIGGEVMRGSQVIGHVTDVAPDPGDARVELAYVSLQEGIALEEDMAFTPSRGAFGGPGGLAVYGRLRPGTYVEGVREPGPEDLVVTIDATLRQTTEDVNRIIRQVSDLLEELADLIDTEELDEFLGTLSSEVTQIADNILRITDRLDTMLAEGEEPLTRTLENVEGMTAEARTLMEGLAKLDDPKLRDNIREIVANLAEASDRLVEVLEDLESYTGDERLRSDIRGAISQARETLEQAQETLETAEATIEDAAASVEAARDIETGGIFSLRYAPEPDRWSGDMEIRVGMERRDLFLVAGVSDIGETERANVQGGWWIGDESTARVGIHRGKLGLGMDWRADAFSFITDLYDANNLRWDVYAGYAFLPEWDVMVGVEDLLDDEEVNFALVRRF